MTATTMSVTDTRETATPGLEKLAAALLFGFVASLQISIAAAGILLSAMIVCWVAMLVADRRWPAAPAFFIPLAAYGAMTLISSLFSSDRMTSLIDSKQLVLLAIVPAVYEIARGKRASTVIDVIVSVGAASAAFGIIQYGLLHYDNLGQRPQGTMSHYMTYSGLLMLVICTAVARLVFGSRNRIWPALVMPALVVALSLTLSRNAWIGACVAVGLLFILKDFRLAGLLPVILAVLVVVAPEGFVNRLTSTFNAQDPSNQDRFAMIEIGAKMVRDHPLVGVGPNMVPRLYEQYRPDYAINKVNPHLHNVPLQIAAERGLPAFALWLWFIAALLRDLWKRFKSGERLQRELAATAMATVIALLTAGLFEYNFGDSEVLMLFLTIITLPAAAARSLS